MSAFNRLWRRLGLLWFLAALAAPAAAAPTFPPLSGRVVDQANILDPAQEGALTVKLEELERQSGRQLVVATVADLQGYGIEDYGYQLGRTWAIGQAKVNDGAVLLVAPNERKVRVEVGYGLEPLLTDAMSSLIINQTILPRFKEGDMPGGIAAGVDAIGQILTLPPDEARARAAKAEQQAKESEHKGWGGGVIIFLIILLFFILPFFRAVRGGRRYRRGGLDAGDVANIVLWGASTMLNSRDRGGGWGGGDWGGGGGGGFSGGGGSFGGGGASGSW